MKLAIMQPYLFPYIGYFQLLKAVDTFVILDDVQWINKGWINRNRILLNKKDVIITLPIGKRSHFDNILEFEISKNDNSRETLLNKISAAYAKSPYFKNVFPLVQQIVLNNETNLAKYIEYSLRKICEYLKIDTQIVRSSDFKKGDELRAQEKIIEICRTMNGNTYINPIGGLNLYNKDIFVSSGLKINFLKTREIRYEQFGDDFISNLSIIDVLMFNSRENIIKMLDEYELL